MNNEESHFKSVHIFLTVCICILFVINFLAMTYATSEIIQTQEQMASNLDQLNRDINGVEHKVDTLPFRVTTVLEDTTEDNKKAYFVSQ